MKIKIAMLTLLVFITGAVAFREGYDAGAKHPRVFWSTNETSQTAFGWDEGNKCVASWTRWTNGLNWQRLEESPYRQLP